jgi:hypothetical protein
MIMYGCVTGDRLKGQRTDTSWVVEVLVKVSCDAASRTKLSDGGHSEAAPGCQGGKMMIGERTTVSNKHSHQGKRRKGT